MSDAERTAIAEALDRQAKIIDEVLRLMRETNRAVVNHAELDRRVSALERRFTESN